MEIKNRHILYLLASSDVILTSFILILPSHEVSLDLNPEVAIGALVLLLVSFIFFLIGIVGIFLIKHWGRVCYLLSFLFSLIVSVPFVAILTGVDLLGLALSLIIVLYIFLGSIAKEFEK